MAKRRKPATESQAMYQDLMRQRQQEEMPPEQMTHEDFINYATRRLPMASLVKA